MNTLNATIPAGSGPQAKLIRVLFGMLPNQITKDIAQAYKR